MQKLKTNKLKKKKVSKVSEIFYMSGHIFFSKLVLHAHLVETGK